MKSKTDELVEWLRDAYAMERSMEQMLKRISEDPKAMPILKEIAFSHLQETIDHASRVEDCLKLLDAEPSAVKTGVAEVSEVLKDGLARFASDKQLKDLLSGYAGEHFEIACYTAIKEAASVLGQLQIVDLVKTIIDDERKMAQRLHDLIPQAVDVYLSESH